MQASPLQILVHRTFFSPPVCVEIFNVTFHDYVLLEKNNQSNSVISQIKARKLYAALPTTLY